MSEPWEHPDWYDLHDTTWTAGPERELITSCRPAGARRP